MSNEDDLLGSTEISLIDSVARAEIQGLATDLTEVGIDAVLNNELLEAIPIVDTIVRIYNFTISIRDRLFLRKVLTFLKEFENVSMEGRRKFVEQLDKDAGTRKRAGEALVLLLDRLDDLQKPQIIGRLYLARLENRLPLRN